MHCLDLANHHGWVFTITGLRAGEIRSQGVSGWSGHMPFHRSENGSQRLTRPSL